MYDTTFIDDLASAAPVPGGGGASAYAGALAAALGSMVGNLTVGKTAYAQVEGEAQAALAELASIRARLVELVDEDARAFEPISRAYKMPHASEDEQAARHEAIQAALVGACEPPLETMRQALALLAPCEFLAHHGSRLARSDIGVAAAFARAAADGASLTVHVNAKDMDDRWLAARVSSQADDLREQVRAKSEELFAFVKGEVN